MDAAFIWDRPTPTPPRPRRTTTPGTRPASPGTERISLREAEHRFGIPVATLRTWARKNTVDAVMEEADGTRQWMVTPESVAHHISRAAPQPARTRRRTTAPRRPSTGPTGDGTAMLVPRDAWDRLIDQLGNLHEAGLMLAEARERAAKAETEAGFLRERLAEIRSERDDLRQRHQPASPVRERGRWRLLRRER